jgi:hypothetical protein
VSSGKSVDSRLKDSHEYFVSYNSRDVAIARRMVERMRSESRGVWFSEYEVHSYEQRQFQQRINEGIDASRGAVLVVGARYAESPYCNIEVERLLRRLPLGRIHLCVADTAGLERLLVLYPELLKAPRDWPVEPAPVLPLGRAEWVVRNAGFAFDTSVWALERGSRLREDAWADAFGMAGAREGLEHCTFVAKDGLQARLSLHYAELDGTEAQSIRGRYASPEDERETADRQRLQEEFRYFENEAKRVFQAVTRPARLVPGNHDPARGSVGKWRGGFEEVGAHLFSSRVGTQEIKQRVFSFRQTEIPARFRLYKLSFLHPHFSEAPYAVRFLFRFPDDQTAFFRGVPWCDALVTSFRLLDEAATSTALIERSADFVQRMKGPP